MEKNEKRAAPNRVESLIANGIRYEGEEVREWDGELINAGTDHVHAYDVATNTLLWDSVIYTKTYDADMEEDKQWSFITKLSDCGDGKISVTNEDSDEYIVEALTGIVVGKR